MSDVRSQLTRRSGLVIPLFSAPSSVSWGVGEIPDIELLAAWLSDAGQRILQLLPVNEMALGQQSPYSAASAMAIDSLFVRLPGIPEFDAMGGEAALPPEDRAALAQARRSPHVEYETVRRLKRTALGACFDRFAQAELCRNTDRARLFHEFVTAQAWWIEDYSLFRAIHAREDGRPWTEWPESLQRREPLAIDRARRELSREVLLYKYIQWVADTQWTIARQRARGVQLQLFGDLPFMVDTDSADVWARPHQFNLKETVGAPPDAFSEEGQDWGMPLYRWDVLEQEDFLWLRERARRCADLFDGYRVDHVVGFYRTYARPKDGRRPYFTPADERSQLALGERILTILRETGSQIVAEDLGTVPDFVRASLARQAIAGIKVLRWERLWHAEGQPFRDPSEYDPISAAVSGTHDTEPLLVWWDRASRHERYLVSDLATVRRLAGPVDLPDAPEGQVRDVLLESLSASRSALVLIPVPDVFGWRDRINNPSAGAEANWVFRLPWPIDHLDDVEEALQAKERLRAWSKRHARLQMEPAPHSHPA